MFSSGINLAQHRGIFLLILNSSLIALKLLVVLLGGSQFGFKLFAVFEGPSSEAGPQITSDPATYVDDEVVFRQLCCPGCWTAVYSAVVPKDHPDHVSDVGRFALAGGSA